VNVTGRGRPCCSFIVRAAGPAPNEIGRGSPGGWGPGTVERGPGCRYGVIAMARGAVPTLIVLPAAPVAIRIGVTVSEGALNGPMSVT
jgi:hypothetical protein